MNRIIPLSILMSLASTAFASDLVVDAKISRLASSSDGQTDNFYLEISGGVGPCANTGVVFYRSDAPSEGFFNRMFAIAMLAYSTGSTKVRVYTPSGTSCHSATFIEVKE